ncbi:ParB/RepB/Spo0J family partition protein [Vibrio rotiferianus]
MGSVRKYLFKTKLPSREKHHSRLFIDLAENIHIHHREYRTVFSLDEYFEYADILSKSTKDVRNFLEQNPNYQEQKYPTTIMIAGGKERQMKFLRNSPKPNKSKYFDEDFAIELQDVFVTDEVHIHYRDFRIGLDRERFRILANGFAESLSVLDAFEVEEEYIREKHPDREITQFNIDSGDIDTRQMGVVKVSINNISSHWYSDVLTEMHPDPEAIDQIIQEYNEEKKLVPIILSTEENGEHIVIDGHHRLYASLKLNLTEIDAVITELTFEQTDKLRKAEVLLKQFDEETNFSYGISNYIKSYFSYRLNRYYSNSFKKKMMKQTVWYRALRRIKQAIFGKKAVFKSFNESHNNHN